MKKLMAALCCIVCMKKNIAQTTDTAYPVYTGADLGLSYSPAGSSLRIWSPVAQEAVWQLYHEGTGGNTYKTVPFKKDLNGTWLAQVAEDLKGVFYTVKVRINNTWSNEVADPYAKAVGVNGKRAMVVNLPETNPDGWDTDISPDFSLKNAATDAVIYELHIRDASIHESSGVTHKGKYLGLAEAATYNRDGLPTALSHIKDLGVTHVHLLPFFDYNSVDESKPDVPQYNWGYDPLNYNVPEGSYSTDPYNGATRIKELKTMIAAFHQNGLRVVMDVVYNHVADAASSGFQQLVPGYYFRHKKDGSLSDATACGNETASEMPMMQKFIVESVLYWASEYHIDGFRFDLMGVHDIETMNLLSARLHQIRPDILLYGEGWTAGASPLPEEKRALKKNAALLNGVAVFSDDIRDGIKGSVFEINDRGFASNKPGMEETIKFGVVAAVAHPQVDAGKVNYSKAPYAASPGNVVSYAECHDNNTLWDKLALSYPAATVKERIRMQQLALTTVLTSQGIAFLHAGTELLRSKKGIENSYNAGDSINAIDWSTKKANLPTYKLVRQLVEMRREHPAFRLTTQQAIAKHIKFETTPPGTVAYSIDGAAVKDEWKKIIVLLNGTDSKQTLPVADAEWKTGWVSGDISARTRTSITLDKFSAVVLFLR
jgi:pullulanase